MEAVTLPEQKERLHLECDLCLLAGDRRGALQYCEALLALERHPSLEELKQKLMAALGQRPSSQSSSQSPTVSSTPRSAQINAEDTHFTELTILEREPTNTALLSSTAGTILESTVARLDQPRLPDGDKAPTIVDSPSSVREPSVGIAEQPTNLLPKTLFGRYQIVSKLGQGGMGAVYKAQDPIMDRLVALKVITARPGLAEKQTGRFLQEVKATARLKHPNIISIYDFGESPQSYFTMEYLEGQTLSGLIKEGKLKARPIAQILHAVASALESAHQARIIHRDLKPSNIMLDHEGQPKVMDFGLAKFLEAETGLSQSGDIIGTPAYMPPEQASAGQVDERSDVYSLGAVGYEMFTAQPPFQGDSVFGIIHRLMNQEPIKPRLLNPDLDRDLETIILKCLEKSPAQRYASMTALKEELTRYLENRPLLAKPPSHWTQLQKWMLRNKALSAALTAIILLIFGALIYTTHLYVHARRQNEAQNIVNDVVRWLYHGRKVPFAEITRMFEQARALAPQYFAVYQEWGKSAFSYGGFYPNERSQYYVLAEEKLQHALTLNPADYISLYYLSHIATQRGQHAQACQYVKRIFALRPPNEFGDIAEAREDAEEARTLSGEAQKDLQNKAIALFSKALDYNPSLACVLNSRGQLYLAQQRYAEAQSDFQASLSLEPNHTEVYLYRGINYLQQGLYEKAHADFQQTIELEGNSRVYKPRAYYQLARLLVLQKEEKKALTALAEAFQQGFAEEDWLRRDHEWDVFQNTREFQELLRRYATGIRP